jgi:hypothetical protein
MFTAALAMALQLLTADPQQPAPPPTATVTTRQQAADDARAAAEAASAQEVVIWQAVCREAREAKVRIIAAGVRLGERDPDLMRAWAAADRIERAAC